MKPHNTEICSVRVSSHIIAYYHPLHVRGALWGAMGTRGELTGRYARSDKPRTKYKWTDGPSAILIHILGARTHYASFGFYTSRSVTRVRNEQHNYDF